MIAVDNLQTATDMKGRGGYHTTALDDRKLGRAAADVDVENPLPRIGGNTRGTGTECRQHGLHMVTRGGTDEVAAPLRHDAGDILGVLAS